MSVVARAAALFRPRSAALRLGPIGVDIALEAIHLVQLAAAENCSPVVRARASLPINGTRRELLEQPHQFRSLIKRALAADRFQGKKAVLALPSAMFRTVSINYQLAGSEKNEAAAILRVMKDRLDGDLSDYVLDYMPVRGRSKHDEKLALVAVSEREPVVAYLEFARKAGLDVSALEIGPLAISRLTSAMSEDHDSATVLVVNSGRRASYLTLISGNDLLFDQEVAIGEDSLVQHICETLDMSQDTARHLLTQTGVYPENHSDPVSDVIDESGVFSTLSEILKPQFMKLVEEIKRAFLYAASETRGRGVTEVYLLGSIARWPGSELMLSNLSGSNVTKIPDPLALFRSDKQNKAGMAGQSAPEIAVATGLALRGMKIHG
ncbi:MAG: pilus assembly protein PilM [Gammaproteobacteria bacterium]|nr:pilus assembly protein PilM [Gammaproteobacteria bacterium]